MHIYIITDQKAPATGAGAGCSGNLKLETVLARKLRHNLEDGMPCWSLGDGPPRMSKMKWGGKALGKTALLLNASGWSRYLHTEPSTSELHLGAMHPCQSFILGLDALRSVF